LRGSVNGKRLYQRNCAACHLDDLSGTPPTFPALTQPAMNNQELGAVVRG